MSLWWKVKEMSNRTNVQIPDALRIDDQAFILRNLSWTPRGRPGCEKKSDSQLEQNVCVCIPTVPGRNAYVTE